jgi:Membrane bound O-acyl transferase family
MTPLGRMLVIIASTLVVTKALTLAAARAQGTVLGPRATAEFLGWMGMRPALFARKRNVDARGAAALAGHGARTFLAGAMLFVSARIVATAPLELPWKRGLVTIVAMIGLSLMLHFGFFDLVAGFYRLRGVPVGKLFRAPLEARSLSEFWSRRWNIGFSEMIALVVHRPVRRNAGESAALAASFLASGLLHELAISVPVRAGYGLPTTYFLLHGALVGIERRMGRSPGQLWTIFWLAAPLPLLFHPPFLRGVIWPLVGLA